MTEHAPLPWHLVKYTPTAGAESAPTSLFAADDSLVATVNWGADVAPALTQANAEFILRACNNYQELLEAL